MKKSRFSEEQVIGILKQHEAGVKTAGLCREHVDSTSNGRPIADKSSASPGVLRSPEWSCFG